MRKIDLLPTEENLLTTLQEDLLERNKDIWYFIELLDNIEDSCSIALDGRWGSGKTFFCKHAKLLLDANNNFIDAIENRDTIKEIFRSMSNGINLKSQVTVYYDAWVNDNDLDPILSLMYTIVKDADEVKRIGKSTDILRILGEITQLFTGKNINGLYRILQGEDILQKIREQKGEQDRIAEFLNSLLPERGDRMIVIIDELDRCKPLFTVQLLERIKHYFCNDKITFIFATNLLELRHTIKRIYGEEFNADLYLDRFFDFRITLPKVKVNKFYNKLGLDRWDVFEYICQRIIRDYDFELREISKFYNQAKLVGYSMLENSRSRRFMENESIELSILLFVPMLIGLRIKNIVEFNEFRNGKNMTPLIDLFGDGELINYYLLKLLNKNEVFDKGKNEEAKIIKIEDKLKEIYTFLFANKDAEINNKKRIGDYIFDISTRDLIEHMINGLTDKNYYE